MRNPSKLRTAWVTNGKQETFVVCLNVTHCRPSLCVLKAKVSKFAGAAVCSPRARTEEETSGQLSAIPKEPKPFPSHPMPHLKLKVEIISQVGPLNLCNSSSRNPVILLCSRKRNCGRGERPHNAIDCLSQSNIDSVYASQTPRVFILSSNIAYLV